MFIYKAMIDFHNEPMKARVGGFTHWIYAIEGDWTYHIQDLFLNDFLTNLSIWALPIHVPVYDLVFTNVLHFVS